MGAKASELRLGPFELVMLEVAVHPAQRWPKGAGCPLD